MDEHLVRKLWEAVNNHSNIMFGEYVVPSHVGIDIPKQPDDEEEVIKIVTQYLETTI